MENSLSRVEQAAMIMLSLPEEQAVKVFRYLQPMDVQQVSQKMASLKSITHADAESALQRFFSLYEQHAGISKADKETLSRTLHQALGETVAKTMLESIYGDEARDMARRLEWVDSDLLAEEVGQEHYQLQANLLAMLPPKKSAEVLALLPEYSHDDLLYRVASLDHINDDVFYDLKDLIERCVTSSSQKKGAKIEGTKQVADIVNNYSGPKERLVSQLRIQDALIAEEVEAQMFDFSVLGRQSDEVLQVLAAEASQEVLALALKGADIEIRNAVFGALPKRMAQAIQDQMKMQGAVPISKAEQARQDIMDLAKKMMNDGRLDLQLFDDPVVE